ncbi:ribosome hibernation-promoting factor, HPF/YfiA family [Salinarimonas soli]|uniref:Ribosome hibernation promoting factor n=1 Tax=Salinarimonas soli TaxID=1638099 RepID=A0A5B2VU65_9HYPH|nr:ribosome-associated translation inhibitor RaiA [Salinarimonas soli]KAA2242148.1 ribosome-associated translation inhibitor RaiA [Salinarimonas soli]
MGLRITGRNMDIGEALRGRIDERIRAGLAKFLDGHCEGHVTVAPDGAAYQIDCVLHLRSGITVEGTGAAHDPYMALDQAALRIEKRLRRHRERLRDRAARTGSGSARETPIEAPYAIIESPDDDSVEAGFSPVVIHESTTSLRRLPVSEAVIELDLTGVPFMMFQHAGTGRLNVVYRRRDGAIGWIDPPAQI